MTKFAFLGTTVLQSAAFTSALMLAQPALAQEAPASADATAQSAPPAPPTVAAQTTSPKDTCEGNDSSGECATVVVTGSRIKQSAEFTSPDPVATIDPALAQKEGKLDTASMLQSSPIAAGSTQITSAISSNFVTAGGPGAQTIDLRGLGANRTLVLLNGRRAGPAGVRGAVSSFDLNVLPQSIVESVEILKTGASSVYGSDAVAGVVNLRTKQETNGLQLDMNVSIPGDGGGEQYRASAIWGKKFDRGHFLVAADYFKQQELARGDRKYLGCPEAYTFRPDGSRADLIDPRTKAYKCEDLRWGHVWTYDLIGNLQLDNGVDTGPVALLQYQYPGENLGIPAYGAPQYPGDFGAPPGFFPTGYDTASLAVQNSYHPFVLEQSIIPKTERYTAYADGAFELTDHVELFGEFLYNRRKTYQNGWRQIWNFGYTGDLYGSGNESGSGTIWAQGFTGVNYLSPTPITNQADTSQKVDYMRGVTGLRGDFGDLLKGWNYDAHVQYSKSNGKYRTQHFLQDVYNSGYFQTSSCVGTVTPISKKQCIDLPWTDPYFLAGQFTPEQQAFMFDWEEGKTVYKQLNSEAVVSGNIINLPHGPLGAAFGVAVRRDSINDTPGDITYAVNPAYDPTVSPTSRACKRKPYPCSTHVSNAWGYSSSGITAGSSVTKELFGEVSVPLIRERPFFRDLTLSGAARLTSVTAKRKSDGFTAKDNGNWTYKVGGNWAVNKWLRFRGTYGTSYRAPALFEQFLADETSFPSQRSIDPCINLASNLTAGRVTQRVYDNCVAAGIPTNYIGGNVTATSIASGGVGVLQAETSKAKTASIILTPTFGFLPDTRLSLAVDYFNIVVKGEISQLGAANIINGCYNSEFFPTDPLCSLFTRGQTGAPLAIATIQDKFVNIASQRNAGVDVSTNIRQNLHSLGTLNFLANMTWQTKDDFALFVDTKTSDNGESGSPRWVGDFNLTWTARNKKLSFFYGMDVIGKTSDKADFLRANGGERCITSTLRGVYCPKLNVPMVFYHNASITKSINDRFDFTLGVSNLFDTSPPRVSVLNGGQISTLGPVVVASQYDFLGRRFFVNVGTRF